MDEKISLHDTASTKGFFKRYFNNFKTALSRDAVADFGKATTDEERMRYMRRVASSNNAEDGIVWIGHGKDSDEAMRIKDTGNKAFAKGDNEEALRLYTEALVKLADNESSTADRAILLANRSACLYHLEMYDAAIRDIDQALRLDYPAELRYKARERRAKSLLAEKRHEEAVAEFRKTLQALDESKLPTERKRKMETDIQIMMGVMTKPTTKLGRVNAFVRGEPKPSEGEAAAKLSGKCHPVYKSASEKIDIVSDAVLGRYAVAVDDIKPGDVLLVESPHCSVLLDEYALTHCTHCCNRTAAPYPCRNCTRAVFCSPECQESAEESYHRYECPIMATAYSSGASVTVLMAMRAVAAKPLKFFVDTRSALSESSPTDLKEYRSSDYAALYHLVRHETMRKSADFFERTFMAWFLLQCLKKAGYFADMDKGADPDDVESFIGSLILRHLQLLQFNAHEMFELELRTRHNSLDDARTVFVGGGIYPTLSLFNHSCDPGVVRYFRGSTVVVRAVKPIAKGEAVAENYGPVFTTTRRDERRSRLRSQYWFECGCAACLEDWPTLDGMDPSVLRFRCDARHADGRRFSECQGVIAVPHTTDEFMAKCSSCGQRTNILKGLKIVQGTDEMFRRASREAASGKCESALDTYLEILRMLNDVMAPPFRDYHMCQQAIRKCMLSMGNTHVRKY